MKKIAYLLVFQFWFISCHAQNHTATTNQKLDRIVENYFHNQEFIGAVLIANNGNIILNKGYGYADIENKIHNSPTTNFFLASVSKLFTVACISDLKNKGLLNYNTPLSKYIPDYPNGKNITIEHLIKHESGIVDVVNERPYVLKKIYTSPSDLIDEFKNLPLNFSPGERYQYSTSGYILLALIIEKVSGMSYSAFIQKNIFDKLKMTSSYSVIDSFPDNQAKGYDKVDGKFLSSDYFNPGQFVGTGNLSSTLEDMYKWYNGLYKTHKISTDYQSAHFGRIGGWTRTGFLFHEHADYVIIILSNYGDALVQEMGNELTDALWGNIQNQNKLSVFELRKFEGFYDYGDDGVLLISERNGSLFAQISGQPENEIFPKSKTEFLWKIVDASVKFVNENEKLFAVHNQNGNIIKAPKIQYFKFNTSELKNIEGEYDYGNDGILTIRESNGKLLAKLSDQSENEIYPISKNEFFWMVVNARIKLEFNEKGEITKAIHFQNGWKTNAPKIK
jgi:CubicO group peptidase (beta-lactamase class C family)